MMRTLILLVQRNARSMGISRPVAIVFYVLVYSLAKHMVPNSTRLLMVNAK